MAIQKFSQALMQASVSQLEDFVLASHTLMEPLYAMELPYATVTVEKNDLSTTTHLTTSWIQGALPF